MNTTGPELVFEAPIPHASHRRRQVSNELAVDAPPRAFGMNGDDTMVAAHEGHATGRRCCFDEPFGECDSILLPFRLRISLRGPIHGTAIIGIGDRTPRETLPG